MAAGSGGIGSSNQPPFSHQSAPKILLAKPALVASAKFNRGAAGGGGSGGGGGGPDDDSSASARSRLPSIGSLNLLSESWEFHCDRFLPFLTDNTEFTVVGVIGPPGVGKSTIMNEIYGFDASLPGMLPPFAVETEETRAMAKHCTVGIEPRISSERIILLDTQPVFSASVLAEIIRPDGSSTIPVINGESLSAELAHELMSIQLGILLASICHIIVVVSDGVHDSSMWHLMSTVDLLKHGIPDPSSVTLSNSSLGIEKEKKDKTAEASKEHVATPIFVHTKLRDQDISAQKSGQLKKALARYFSSSSFMKPMGGQNASKENLCPTATPGDEDDAANSGIPKLFLIPSIVSDESSRAQQESHISLLRKLRDMVLSTSGSNQTFTRTVSERDWLKNSAKIWDIIKNHSLIVEYYRMLQNSGMFRR